jgi:hypothetical protein
LGLPRFPVSGCVATSTGGSYRTSSIFSLINYKLKNKFLIKIRPFDFLAKLSNLAELHRTFTIQGKH